VLPVRVVILTAALNPAVSLEVLPYMALPCAAGLMATGLALRRHNPQETGTKVLGNPLRFKVALQMAVGFQLVLYIMHWASGRFGAEGTLISASLTGMTDVDALIFSMVKLAAVDAAGLAAKALAVGVLSNTLFKLVLALGIGRGAFRTTAGLGLVLLSAASLAALFLF